jgi:hypothetical protein
MTIGNKTFHRSFNSLLTAGLTLTDFHQSYWVTGIGGNWGLLEF